jgi:HlyD family secretion protein
MESGLITYEVTIKFNVPGDDLVRIGMSAEADIVLDSRTGVLLVPDRAIGEDDEGNAVVMVVVGEQTEERRVVVGISDGYDTEIIEGLAEGEVVSTAR